MDKVVLDDFLPCSYLRGYPSLASADGVHVVGLPLTCQFTATIGAMPVCFGEYGRAVYTCHSLTFPFIVIVTQDLVPHILHVTRVVPFLQMWSYSFSVMGMISLQDGQLVFISPPPLLIAIPQKAL